MEETIIEALEDLHNSGKCFTKGQQYSVPKIINNEAGLLEARVINDLGEPHIIGSWWRSFTIVRPKLYKVYKVGRKYGVNGRRKLLGKNLTEKEAQHLVNSYPDSNRSIVLYTEQK